jgi:hypothetical protein
MKKSKKIKEKKKERFKFESLLNEVIQTFLS